MSQQYTYDAVVVGAGPNGLAAAITIARTGRSVLLLEAQAVVGGGTRTEELTLPGFRHDVCSAVQPLGVASPFFQSLPLADYGLDWVSPTVPLAHPLDDGSAAVLAQSLDATAAGLGRDGMAYRRLMGPIVEHWQDIGDAILGPFRIPRHPLTLARFGLSAVRSVRGLAESHFRGARARALLAGLGAHAILPLEQSPGAAFGLVLGAIGHAVGWPSPRGGAQSIADALAAYLRALGGEIQTGVLVTSVRDLPPARAVLLDVTPRQLLQLAGDRLPARITRQLRHYRYGPGVFKLDYALDGPVPWRAAAATHAGTVHLGGTLPESAAAEAAVARGVPPERPFVLTAQQSLFDPSRA
ncbi:MAG TPA: NAD(P)/FAD-dependent oxidoreductase, partial [Chloroflexia bacterium]|nr:NAD(P)/FAD-dependent oxidoreductase [Chloroflexia bacterium]